jgi:hypothetical protein
MLASETMFLTISPKDLHSTFLSLIASKIYSDVARPVPSASHMHATALS